MTRAEAQLGDGRTCPPSAAPLAMYKRPCKKVKERGQTPPSFGFLPARERWITIPSSRQSPSLRPAEEQPEKLSTQSPGGPLVAAMW